MDRFMANSGFAALLCTYREVSTAESRLNPRLSALGGLRKCFLLRQAVQRKGSSASTRNNTSFMIDPLQQNGETAQEASHSLTLDFSYCGEFVSFRLPLFLAPTVAYFACPRLLV